MKIDFSEFGQKGEVIVFLHGWQQDKKSFFPLVPFLFRKYHLYLLDLPGFGGSQFPPLHFSSFDYAEVIAQWLKRKRLKKVILVGHSFGGKVAAIIAAKNPLYVAKLILISNSGIKASLGFEKISLLGKYLPESIKILLLPLFASKDYREAGKLLPIFKTIVKEDIRDIFSKIKTPTLIIWGKRDRELPWQHGKLINQLIRQSELVLLEGDHFPFWQYPDKVAGEIDRFIKG